MSEVKVKTPASRWFTSIIVHSLVLGVPLAGYLMQNPVVDNFATVILIFWALVQFVSIAVLGGGLALANFINDQGKKLDIFEALTKRTPLYYITRALSVFTALVLIFIGYPVFGAWALFCWGVLYYISQRSFKDFTAFKTELVRKP